MSAKAKKSHSSSGIGRIPRPAQASSNGNGVAQDRVVEIQRARMLAAMAEVCAAAGPANVTVAHVVQRAGVSRRTFYEVFGDIEDCLLATFDEAMARAGRRVLDAYDPAARWVERMRASLIALLSFFDEEPAMGRLLVVETLGAGPSALERRQRMLAPIIAAVSEGEAEARKGGEPSPLTAEGIVGGVLGVLHSRLSQAHPEPLSELAGSLMSMIVLPYLGAAAAKSELVRPLLKVPVAPRGSSGSPLNELRMRLTYRTVRVLMALAANPGASNRQVGDASGVSDQGQISKLLARLQELGLVENSTAGGAARGAPNAWTLTGKGWDVQAALAQPAPAR